MRTSTSVVLAAVMLASSMVAATTQTEQSATIGLINGDAILQGSNIGRQAQEQLESSATRWQERLATLQQEVEALGQQRQEQALTLNQDALARLNQDIEEKQVQLQRLNDDARRELERLERQVTVEVNSRLGPLVEQFASQRGFDLILDPSRMQGLLYFGDTIDVTEDFLALVNSTTPDAEQQQ